jgi:uncharacterized SAM-binding protein YcdF (DUF218 family)
MFFLLSKILAFLVTPLYWVFTLLVLALWKTRLQKRLLIAALLTLYFFSNSFILDECLRSWETPALKDNQLSTYPAAIVLGGFSTYDVHLNRPQYNRSTDRLLQTIALYKKGIVKKIIFTGGSGIVLHPDLKEGPLVAHLLSTLNIPAEDVLIEPESRNTRENAVFTAKLVAEQHLHGPFLLVTSAMHMRRSLACFQNVGLPVMPYSTDCYSGPRKFEPEHLLLPNAETLHTWNSLLHEWVGCIVYEVLGYM